MIFILFVLSTLLFNVSLISYFSLYTELRTFSLPDAMCECQIHSPFIFLFTYIFDFLCGLALLWLFLNASSLQISFMLTVDLKN